MKKQVTVLTGAGISAESGIQTFRGADGLWEGYDVREVASPEGWQKDRELVLEFYNQRRRQLHEVDPNAAHLALVDLEAAYDVRVITQNIDNLHERAGSSQIIHLHGELFKARSTADEGLIYDWEKDIQVGDRCEKGSQLRPHIVWFGEMVPEIHRAAEVTTGSDVVLIVGTSMQVYPAASLVGYAAPEVPIYYIDPNPALSTELGQGRDVRIVQEAATTGVPRVVKTLLELAG
ncbi:MAG: NAD-dependent deacylase [Bacteroidota bacterium]